MLAQRSFLKKIIGSGSILLPFILIALTVIVVWLPFGLNTTPTGEMWFQRNEVESLDGIRGSLIRQNDRIFWFWSVALGNWLSPNTYVGHQIVFIFVYILRGVLTYLILQKLFPKHNKWALVVSLISLFNPIEPSRLLEQGSFWLGALHVHAHNALFLLPVYMLIQIWEKSKWWKWVTMVASLNIVLWSYEGTLLLNLAVPALLFYLERTWWLSKYALKMILVWYISPVLSVIIRSYMFINKINAHFVTKADTSLQFGEILDGLIKAFYQLFFAWFEQIERVIQNKSFLLYGAFIFTLVFLFLRLYRRGGEDEIEDRFNFYFPLALGIIVIVLGFMPYTFTDLLRYRYDRTLIIPWIGASIIFATIFWQFLKIEKRGFVTFFLSGFFVALTVVFALNQHNRLIDKIQLQNNVLAKIIKTVPHIENGSAILLIYEYDCARGEKGCELPLSALRSDRVFVAALRFIYNDNTLGGYAVRMNPKDSYSKVVSKNIQWPLNKLVIIRYYPQSNKIVVENDIPPDLISSKDFNVDEYRLLMLNARGNFFVKLLNADAYQPELLYSQESPLPYRACKIFPEYFVDNNACLPVP